MGPVRLTAVRLSALALVLALAAGCASSGLRRVAIATEHAATAIEVVQRTADALEADGVLTRTQRDSLSPYIVRLARADLALAQAVARADQATVHAEVLALLALLDEWATALGPLPERAQLTLRVSLDAVRAVVLVISTGVA